MDRGVKKCYRCKGRLVYMNEKVPHDSVWGICVNCGIEYGTEETQLTVEQVNMFRLENRMGSINQLRKVRVARYRLDHTIPLGQLFSSLLNALETQPGARNTQIKKLTKTIRDRHPDWEKIS